MQPGTNLDRRISDRRRLATWPEVDFIFPEKRSDT